MVIHRIYRVVFLWVVVLCGSLSPSTGTGQTPSSTPTQSRPGSPSPQGKVHQRGVFSATSIPVGNSAASRPVQSISSATLPTPAVNSSLPPSHAPLVSSPSHTTSPSPTLPLGRQVGPPRIPSMQQLLSPPTFFWSQFFGMLVALGVVVMLIYVVLRWVAQQTGIQTPGQHSLLRVCDRISLEPKKGIWVVEVAGQYLVLATHEHGVTLLDKLDPDTTRERLGVSSQQTQGGFWEWWKNRRIAAALAKTQVGVTSSSPPTTLETDSDRTESSKPSIPTHFEVVSDGQKTSPSTQK